MVRRRACPGRRSEGPDRLIDDELPEPRRRHAAGAPNRVSPDRLPVSGAPIKPGVVTAPRPGKTAATPGSHRKKGNEMKPKLKRLVLATMALCALAGAASASGATPAWYVGGAQLSGSTALTAKSNIAGLPKFYFDGGINVECGGETAEVKGAALTSPTSGHVEAMVFNGCHLIGASECELSSTTFQTKPLTMEAALGKTSPEDSVVFKPTAAKGPWAEFTLEGGSCQLLGTWKIQGQAKFLLPKGRTEAAEQELKLHSEGNELTSAAGDVLIGGALKLKLSSGKAWSLH
jgi:hypothetical protein